MKKIFLILGLLSLIGASHVYALNFGTQITIDDKSQSGPGTKLWWQNTSEDQEVEQNCVATQKWDLEGFFLNKNILSMVGGYDFVNGVKGYTSGDLFIDTNHDAKYGIATGTSNGYKTVSISSGYDYVVDLDFVNSTYNIYAINANSKIITPYFAQNQGSGPWQYNAADNNDTLITNGNFSILSNLSDSDTGFLGDSLINPKSHYALQGIDVGFLGLDQEFIAHFTMGCGNDNLMGEGKTAPVPEPATMTLVGLGLLGFASIRKKSGQRK
jgi:hypothetical protein